MWEETGKKIDPAITLRESGAGSARFNSLHCRRVLLLGGNAMSVITELSEVWQGLGTLAPAQAANSQKPGEERGEGKTDGVGSRHIAQHRQTRPRRNPQSKYNCVSRFCATLAKRARLFCFFFIHTHSKVHVLDAPGLNKEKLR